MGTPMENPEMEQYGVRFATHNQEIAPEEDLHTIETLTGHSGRREDLNPEAEQELAQLKTTLRNNIQSARMQHHNFEAVSLPGSAPASRVSRSCSTPELQQELMWKLGAIWRKHTH
jgi:hypothetical protein